MTLPLPLLVGGAALAALSSPSPLPESIAAAGPSAAERAAVAETLDRLPVQLAIADMVATREAEPAKSR